jgi:hypothetical protein
MLAVAEINFIVGIKPADAQNYRAGGRLII